MAKSRHHNAVRHLSLSVCTHPHISGHRWACSPKANKITPRRTLSQSSLKGIFDREGNKPLWKTSLGINYHHQEPSYSVTMLWMAWGVFLVSFLPRVMPYGILNKFDREPEVSFHVRRDLSRELVIYYSHFCWELGHCGTERESISIILSPVIADGLWLCPPLSLSQDAHHYHTHPLY